MTVDLHLHTTASDGRCTPLELVNRAARAGVTVLSVTDHDTTAAVDEVVAAGRSQGIDVIAGIEVTAIESGRDIHILGYFIDPVDSELAAFLGMQREQRIARVEAVGARLAELEMPIDVAAVVALAIESGGRSIGRPQIARAMVAAGYVADTREAFDKWLATGRPAFIPRAGASPEEVIAILHDAHGIASLAHPGQTAVDGRIAAYVEAGLDALEAHHPDHDATSTARYRSLAGDLGLLVTGGSDFHGDPSHGWEPGAVSLPADAWRRLREAVAHG